MTTPERRLGRIAAGFNAKARRLRVRGVVTASMLAQKPSRCFYCGIDLSIMDGSWDHQIAFERGGSNDIENIVRCCIKCQREKFTKTPQEYDAHRALTVTCALPGCDKTWQPRWAEYRRGMARYCSLSHAAKSRWVDGMD